MRRASDSPTSNVVLIRKCLSSRTSDVNYTLYLVLIEHLPKFALISLRENDTLDSNIRNVAEELLDDRGGAIKLEAKTLELLRNRDHFRLGHVTTNEDTRVSLGDLEAGGAEKRSPIGFMDILAEGSNFTSAGHFYEYREPWLKKIEI